MNFGQKLKELRLRKRLTLRDCAGSLAVDPSNWSKLERGVTPAPKDSGQLSTWAAFFDLGTEEQRELFDLAALSRHQIPTDLVSNEELMAKLPAFFRVMRGQELEGDRLTSFVEELRALHSNRTSDAE